MRNDESIFFHSGDLKAEQTAARTPEPTQASRSISSTHDLIKKSYVCAHFLHVHETAASSVRCRYCAIFCKKGRNTWTCEDAQIHTYTTVHPAGRYFLSALFPSATVSHDAAKIQQRKWLQEAAETVSAPNVNTIWRSWDERTECVQKGMQGRNAQKELQSDTKGMMGK